MRVSDARPRAGFEHCPKQEVGNRAPLRRTVRRPSWPFGQAQLVAHPTRLVLPVPACEKMRTFGAHGSHDMSESNKPGPPELKELMSRVLESDASQAFGQFIERRVALSDMAPSAEDAVLDGIEESPDGGAAMAEAHLLGLPDHEREELLERAAAQTGRRLHAAAWALLTAVDAARLPVEVTPEMVAVAAITELGDSMPPDSARRHR
jgi:hypothetical protein